MTRRRIPPISKFTNDTPEARAKFLEELAKLRVYLHNRIKRRQRVEAAERKYQQLVEEFQREILDIYQRHIKAAKREVVRDAGRKGNKRHDATWAEIEPVRDTLDPGLSLQNQAIEIIKRLGLPSTAKDVAAMTKRISRRQKS